MGLLTTNVGWFPKPVALRRARWRFEEGEIEEAELRAAEAGAVKDVLKLQDELGLDVLVDGQMERSDMVGFFGEKLEGMEPGGLVRCFDNRYYRRPRIVGEVEREGPVTVEGWKAAQATASKPVKAVLTGPYTLMDWSFDEHYGSREACCLALAEIVRAEAEDLLAAGAKEIQIDEPAISTRPEEMDLVVEALGRVTGALGDKARTWTHICYGELLPVIDRVFSLPVDGLLLEMVSSGHAILDRLGDLPQDKLLGAGVVDVHSPDVESVDAVRARVDRLLERVPAERLWLMPDSGLRTLTTAVATAKLRSIVAAASAV
ncbi:MAG: methionine synthase [Planctomycetota bacterium]